MVCKLLNLEVEKKKKVTTLKILNSHIKCIVTPRKSLKFADHISTVKLIFDCTFCKFCFKIFFSSLNFCSYEYLIFFRDGGISEKIKRKASLSIECNGIIETIIQLTIRSSIGTMSCSAFCTI